MIGADLLLDFDIQNGPDSLVLRSGDDLLDAVGFGVFGPEQVFAGEGSPAPDVPAGSSLARRFANVDTDDNASDFVEQAMPTPGSAPLAPVPEPGVASLCALGLAGLAAAAPRAPRRSQLAGRGDGRPIPLRPSSRRSGIRKSRGRSAPRDPSRVPGPWPTPLAARARSRSGPPRRGPIRQRRCTLGEGRAHCAATRESRKGIRCRRGSRPRMLPGFNTNVRHGGALFHVQTEDSGRSHPHVITHLYHGGTILASEKRSYADQIDAPDLSRRVRDVMDSLHQAMLAQLRSGDLDEQIEARLGREVFTAGGTRSKSGSGRTQRADANSEPEPTIPPDVARPMAGLTTPILPPAEPGEQRRRLRRAQTRARSTS